MGSCLLKVFTFVLQIDLIDMRHLPHGNNKWILHCVDHWSKFNFAYALDAKTASNVAGILITHIFPYFGVPRILHSDNGREFVNIVIVDLLKCWNSNIQLVSGRPRHPQSQGLVERAHQTLHKKMAAEISASGMKTPPWSDWLPRIVCKLDFLNLYLFSSNFTLKDLSTKFYPQMQ